MPTQSLLSSLPTRAEANPETFWDLTSLFQSDSSWEEEFARFPSEETIREKLQKEFVGKLGSSPDTLLRCLQYMDETLHRLHDFYVYASLRVFEDKGNAAADERLNRLKAVKSRVSALFSFVKPEMLAIPDLSEWADLPGMKDFSRDIKTRIRLKKHVLHKDVEAAIKRLMPVIGAAEKIYEKWLDVDLKFSPPKDSDGKEHELTHASWRKLSRSKDQALRLSVYESLFGAYANSRHAVTEMFSTNKRAVATLASLRGYPSSIEYSLYGEEIPVDVYRALVAETRKRLPESLHKATALKAARLGRGGLFHLADRGMNIIESPDVTFTFEEAVELVLGSLAPMGEEYVAKARLGLTVEKWVDWGHNQGKHSGAFSWGTYGSNPIILMNFDGSLSSVFTLAHELGHSMHKVYSNAAQPLQTASYATFVAETASTLCEALLEDHIMKTRPDLTRNILSQRIKNFEGTMLRQTMFAAFEDAIGEAADADGDLSPDRVNEIYAGLVKEWFGPSLDVSDRYLGYGWMEIPHFYRGYYVFQYATSFCASQAIAKRLLTGEAGQRVRVIEMLKAGCSKSPIEILRDAGVDFTSTDLYDDAFSVYQADIEKAESID